MKSSGKGVKGFLDEAAGLEKLIFTLILISGVTLRLFGYQTFGFSNDELSAITRLDFPDFISMIKYGVEPDGHPAGVQVLLYFILNVFGNSATMIRLPFVVMGSLAILFFYLSAKKVLGAVPALFIASSIAFLEFPILYSQLARPYGSGFFLASLLLFFWVKIVFEFEMLKMPILVSIGLALAFALNLYNHYFSAQLAFLIGLSGLFFARGKQLIYYLFSGVLTILLFSPHISISLKQLGYGGVGNWLGAPGIYWFTDHLKYIFNNSLMVMMALVFVMLYLKIRGDKQGFTIKRGVRILALSLFLIPFLTGFFYSRIVNPVLQNSVLIFSFPFLLFFIFSFANKILSREIALVIAFYSSILLISTVYINGYYGKQHWEEYSKIPAILNSYEGEYGTKNITNACHINTLKYLDFYSNGKNFDFKTTYLRSNEDLLKLGRVCDSTDDQYFCLVEFQPVNQYAHQVVKSRFPKLIDYQNFGGITKVYLFKKGNIEIPKTTELVSISDTIFDSEYFSNYEQLITTKSADKFKFKALLNFQLDTTLTNLSLVVDFFDSHGKSISWNGIPLRYFHSKDSMNLIYEDEFTIPKKSVKAKVYLWNLSKEKIKVIDYKLFSNN